MSLVQLVNRPSHEARSRRDREFLRRSYQAKRKSRTDLDLRKRPPANGKKSDRNRLFPETFSGALFLAIYLVCVDGGGGRPQVFKLSLSRTLRGM